MLRLIASQLAALRSQRDQVAVQAELLVEAHSLQKVLTSMPGIGITLAGVMTVELAGKTLQCSTPGRLCRLGPSHSLLGNKKIAQGKKHPLGR